VGASDATSSPVCAIGEPMLRASQSSAAKDGYLIGPRGKRFIDFTSGWCVGNFGWNNRSIRATIRNFKGLTYVWAIATKPGTNSPLSWAIWRQGN
jgi:adenosylmethionine-8-amino-7-oxononanoate aminotransferase